MANFQRDYLHATASLDLYPQHIAEMRRLQRQLTTTDRFALIVLEYNQQQYRDLLVERINATHPTASVLHLDDLPDFSEFETRLSGLSSASLLHVFGLDRWFAGAEGDARIRGFNYHRELIARLWPRPMLLWMFGTDIRRFATQAPDMWAWRTMALDFNVDLAQAPLPASAEMRYTQHLDTPLDSRIKRINQIHQYLDASKAPTPAEQTLQGNLLVEWGELLVSIGQPDSAMERYRQAITLYEKLGDERSRAVTMGQIADILQARGNLDEALRIRREEELPVYEKLGDVRSLLLGRTNLALLLLDRGESADMQEIKRLLNQALVAAVRMQLPEAGQIAGIMKQIGLPLPEPDEMQSMLECFSLKLEP